ncbi:MAG: hemerythrin domain-containing protein [Dehalococcoidia bacterium]|nr:hemerythrin domain-containing protein [Dehalococcoidia bacterium]
MPDALQLLRQQHDEVKEIFKKFSGSDDTNTRKEFAQKAMLQLVVHTKLEEEIFYPAVRAEGDTDSMMNEALEEHHVADLLIEELHQVPPSNPQYEAKFEVLAEAVRHHIEEEESEMFPKASELGRARLDALGEEMEQRKPALMRQAQKQQMTAGKGRASRAGGAGSSRGRATAARGTSRSRPSGTAGSRGRTMSGGRASGTRTTGGARSGGRASATRTTDGMRSGGTRTTGGTRTGGARMSGTGGGRSTTSRASGSRSAGGAPSTGSRSSSTPSRATSTGSRGASARSSSGRGSGGGTATSRPRSAGATRRRTTTAGSRSRSSSRR